MTRIVIDDVLREKLLGLQGDVELCDASGRVLARVVLVATRVKLEAPIPPISRKEFERRLSRALGEMVRVLKPGGIVAIVFAHTDVEAWEHLLRALQRANLIVSTSWPMRSAHVIAPMDH